MPEVLDTYTPLQFVAGDAPHRSMRVTLPANQAVIPGLTPMKFDADFKCVPATALTDKIVGVTVPGVGSAHGTLAGTSLSTQDQLIHVYTHIDLFGDQVNYTAMPTANNNLKKASIFAGTGINLTFSSAGE